MKRILAALLFLTLPAGATVRFLNSGAGGSGNGSTWANGYVSTTTMNTASSGWAAGDTLCIAGGTYGGQGIVTAHAGTSGNQITYKRASASDSVCGSTTSGWSGAFDALVTITNGALIHNSFVTIDGTVANGILMPVSNSSGDPSAIGVDAPTSGVIIRNIEISEPGCGSSGCNQNGDSRAIDMNHFNGSTYDLQTNWLIEHNYLHGQCTILWSAHSTGLVIQYTKFADSADNTPGNPNCHPNVMATEDTAAGTFRYNEVTNWQVEGMMTCPNGACAANWDIYGNNWHDPMSGSFPRVYEAQGSTCATVHAYNNTFVGIAFASFTTANSGCYAGGSAGLNNIYYATAGSGLPSNDYDAFNGSTGGETHGQSITSAIFTNFAGKDYTLATNTAAGFTLSSPFNTDPNGTARGANGTWDRGYYQIPTTAQIWWIRPDGGTRFSTNVPTGQCDGLADVAYPGSGTNQHCSWRQFRYLWDDDSGVCPLGCAGQWVPAGGDTVVVRGCTANASEVNPANPACRLGWDNGNGGGPTNLWCTGIGSYTCYSPPIPAGTAGQHTRILGQCVLAGNCNTGNITNRSNLTQLFAGFSLKWAFNLSSTQYVDIQGIELTTHNGACSHHGAPNYPRGCSTSSPGLDDYADNGFLTNNTTSNILLQDVYVDGFESDGLYGPIGGPITMTRVFVGFNAQAGYNFDDGSDTPDASGSQILASYVTMEGNGCKQQYPLVNAFPALACWDTNSGGFGDGWSGQDTILDTFNCDHCSLLYNTKDGYIGPHTQILHSQITNSFAYGNMGAAWKWGEAINGTILFQNNLTVANPWRMAEAVPGAAQNFNQSTGLPGSYLTNYNRGNAGMATITRTGSVNHYYGNTFIAAGVILFQYGCGFYTPVNVFNQETNCVAVPNVFEGNNFLGYTDPATGSGSPSALYFVTDTPGVYTFTTASFNNEFGLKSGTTDTCGVNNITCVDPLVMSEPAQVWPGSEAALDVFNAFGGSGNSFYPAGGSPLIGAGTTIAGLTTDYYATVRPSPPALGGVEPAGGTPVVATPTASPVAGTYSSTQSVTLSTVTGGATICYTTNGTTPGAAVAGTCDGGSTTYTGTITVATTTTIKAIGTLSGDTNSGVFSGLYTITPPTVATPTGSPVPATYTSTQTVTVSTVTAGATICGTVNGSTPTASPAGTCTNGTGGPFVISSTTTIKAIGTKSGDTDSGLFSGLYTITPPPPPQVQGTNFSLHGTVQLQH